MNAQHETQLSHDLRQLVASRPVSADIDMSADIDAAVRRGRQARRRSVAYRSASGLGAVAVAAGAVVISAHGSPGPAPSTAAPGPATPSAGASRTAAPQVETAAYVIKRTEAALANVSQYVVRDDVTSTTNDDYTIWTDPRTGNTYMIQGSGTGKLAAWGSTYLVKKVMHWSTIQVNYGPRTWWDSVIHAAGPIQGAPPSGPTGGFGGTPDQIKEMLTSGRLTIVGHREINGHEATGLKGPFADGYREVWVDSATFQPLQVIQADFANKPGPLQHDVMVTNETWLPRSASLVNLVNHPKIPVGFTQVPAPQ